MSTQKTFREVLAERRDFEPNNGERRTDIGANAKGHRMNTPELVRHLVATQLSEIGQEAGHESFEEADDFEDEDPEPPWVSQFEIHQMDEDKLEPFHSVPEERLPQEERTSGNQQDKSSSFVDQTGNEATEETPPGAA